MPSIHTSITKTAHDALHAKQSAVRAGYSIGDDLYRELLLQSSSSTSKQSPLVHAGYAVRVACVLHAIQSFINYHPSDDVTTTIVILGAGLDVTGLWAALRFSGTNVIELDVPEICHIKAEQWKNSPYLNSESVTGNVMFQGKSTTTGGSYTLLAADLRNRTKWEKELRQLLQVEPTSNSSSRAYLVLSELVMTYLEDCDPILEFCSQLPNCCLAAYEPFGTNDDNNQQSVLEEYKRAYLCQFKDKLDKGNALSSSSRMYPLGGCAETVTSRLQQYFPRAYVTNAGHAASSQGIELRIPEPFDENIALTLHLQSYMLACAFSSSHETLLQRIMCPWTIGYVPQQIPGLSQTWITPLELEDEAAIRDLFSQSYQYLFEHYPSIKKMVQTALKKDMALSTDTSTSSQMRKWFCDRDGDIFVAVQRNPRTVLGGIAVRKCTPKEARTHDSTIVDVFELHRLVVHPDWYQRGIGRALLESIERQIILKTRDRPVLLTATTFAGLEGANHFYSACGFGSPRPFLLGDLPMHTYQKEIQNNEEKSYY